MQPNRSKALSQSDIGIKVLTIVDDDSGRRVGIYTEVGGLTSVEHTP
jgi:hypothetical protein